MRVVRLLMLGVLLVLTAMCFQLAWSAAQELEGSLAEEGWWSREIIVRVMKPVVPRRAPPPEEVAPAEELEAEPAPPPKWVGSRRHLPRPVVAPVEPDSSLVAPEDAIRMALRLKRPALEHCYNQELKKQATFDGFVLVSLSLSADGRVTAARVEEGTRRDAQVGACIIAQLRQLRLPPLTEEVDLIIPIRLEAKKET